ncbi:MAG: thiamine pyrophosphate-dependent dehydrogenase E1 component subunit alpha [Propioniciclava sp.]
MSQALRAALAQPVERYRRMVEIRVAEDTVNELFASGTIHGTTHLCQGQEALAVGLASGLRPDDAVTATYRGHGVALALGLPLESLFGEIMGKTSGAVGGLGGSMHLCLDQVGLLPTFAIVGAGLPVAAGSALAFQVRGEPRVAAAVFGDGASNIGAFHESLNLAAIWHLPVIFILDHNVYGEYSRWDVTTPFEDLHRRAASYDIPGVQVDGMDVDAVRSTIEKAAERARSGGGPTLVEAKTYRFSGHSRSDTAPYRPPGELEEWQRRDPLTLTRAGLEASGIDPAHLDAIETEAAQAVRRAVDAAQKAAATGIEGMFSNVGAQG